MDPYKNFLPDWYKDQIELMTKLSKDLTADFANIHVNTPDLQLPSKMDIIGKIAPQNQTAVQQLENYKWHVTPPTFIDDATQQAINSIRADALAALNPDITKINASLSALDTANASIQKIVSRAIELSTMQGQVDEETEPEEVNLPNAVEEFVQDYPEEAESVAKEAQNAVRDSTESTKVEWDSFSTSKKLEFVLVTYMALSDSAFSAVSAPNHAYALGQTVNNLVVLLVTYYVLLLNEKENLDKDD